LRRSGTRFIASLVAGLTGLSLTTTGTAAASAGPDRQEVTRALDLMTATGAAGAQVRITAGGRQLTARSGVARLGASRGVPVNGRFRIASVTKTFTAIPGPHAHGYTQRDGALVDVTAMNPSVGWAAGEIISTTADLDTFTAALFAGRLLAPAQLTDMTTVSPAGGAYGLGLSTNVLACGVRVWGHTGDVPGYDTLLASTRDGHLRLQLSLTTATRQQPLQGYRELIDDVFCS
jgi:CubicO group peptidase (beta-lactamase class C family)